MSPASIATIVQAILSLSTVIKELARTSPVIDHALRDRSMEAIGRVQRMMIEVEASEAARLAAIPEKSTP